VDSLNQKSSTGQKSTLKKFQDINLAIPKASEQYAERKGTPRLERSLQIFLAMPHKMREDTVILRRKQLSRRAKE
jgi:hypothetical protein